MLPSDFLSWVNNMVTLSEYVSVSLLHHTGSGWCPYKSSKDADEEMKKKHRQFFFSVMLIAFSSA